MVKIFCELINREILDVAKMICNRQQTDVKIITTAEIVEVRYEKISEMQNSETKKTS